MKRYKTKSRVNIFAIIFISVLFLAVVIVKIYIGYPKKNNQPNVILITIDSLRPDHLGCYGYKRNTSPNIDRIAKEGVIFTQAIAQSSHTLASVPSFITSAYPHTHFMGYISNVIHAVYLDPNTRPLSTILRDYDYRTVLFSDYADYLGKIKGIKESFDVNFETDLNSPEKLTVSALEWLTKNKNKSFLYGSIILEHIVLTTLQISIAIYFIMIILPR